MAESDIKSWVIYQPSKRDYDVSIWKEELEQIKNWEPINSHLYYRIHDEIIKRDLVILLAEPSNAQYEWAKFDWWKEQIKMWITEELLDNLLKFEWNIYEHRYDPLWNKILFWVNEKSHSWLTQFRRWVSDDIELYDEFAVNKHDS